MDLGIDENDILNKGIEIIKNVDMEIGLEEGDNQIRVRIDGFEVEIRANLKDGQIRSFDMFKGWSKRDINNANIINLEE